MKYIVYKYNLKFKKNFRIYKSCEYTIENSHKLYTISSTNNILHLITIDVDLDHLAETGKIVKFFFSPFHALLFRRI